MRYQTFLEGKKMSNTMIGYSVQKSKLSKVYSYIKGWLDRYNIKYNEVKSPHFTIAMIPDTVDKSELVRDVQSISTNISFNPKGVEFFEGRMTPKDYIVIEYKPNKPFIDEFNKIAEKHNVVKFGTIKPHTSLFVVDKGEIKGSMWNDMKHSIPKLPRITVRNVELWNSRKAIEFRTKK